MLKIKAAELIELAGELGTLSERCWVSEFDSVDLKPEHVYGGVREIVYSMRGVLEDVPISRHLLAAINNSEFELRAEQYTFRSFEDLRRPLLTLLEAITIELQGASFLYITESRAPFYEQTTPLFGEAVADSFPAAVDDIAAAGRCIAVEEWTAVVFHLMRVAEHGLRSLARELDISLSDHVDLESWKVIIDQINKAIKAYEEEHPRSADKTERLRIYSQSAVTLRHFKNAWRNHISHAAESMTSGMR